MMKEVKYTKEQAEQVLKDWFEFKENRETTTKTYENFINHKFFSITLNCWYKSKIHDKLLICPTFISDNGNLYGYGFDQDGKFVNVKHSEHGNFCLCNSIAAKDLLPASEDEVKRALITEARSRGIKEGARVKRSWQGARIVSIRSNNIRFLYTTKILLMDSWEIFIDGIWAEIVEEPVELTLEEIAEKFNIPVEQLKIKK